MARQVHNRDISATLAAAERWIRTCLIEEHSILSDLSLWTPQLSEEVFHAFVEHPDYGQEDFLTKLIGQMNNASAGAKQLTAEMLWALLLFPSNIKPRTKRMQVSEIWELSGATLPDQLPLMRDDVLQGIGSGGPGFNTYRPNELTYLIALVRDLKKRDQRSREKILTDYDAFIDWVGSIPRKGSRQFRHMLRFFAFPDRVERMSSNNDRRTILRTFGVAPQSQIQAWNDRQLDEALLKLRTALCAQSSDGVFDFYKSEIKEKWSPNRKIKTGEGEVTVTVPVDNDEDDEKELPSSEINKPEFRRSLQIQAKLAEIGISMGLKIWIPKSDRAAILRLISDKNHESFLDELPLSYDLTTLDTIKQIDVLWLNRRSIVRAFEVEHTTAIYSGLLRMADLLALQPNMKIQLHIVGPDERRDKAFHEMLRPVFSLLERGPLSDSCTFLSYDSVEAIRSLEHLDYMDPTIIAEYEEIAET